MDQNTISTTVFAADLSWADGRRCLRLSSLLAQLGADAAPEVCPLGAAAYFELAARPRILPFSTIAREGKG